jgi:CMP-N-acetylneuraminic acid synthetase
MIAYAIECAVQSGVFDEVFVNTDSDTIAALAAELNVAVYRRPAELGGDDATGDDFTADFIEKIRCDTAAMISPVCPLLAATDIRNALTVFQAGGHDTLISCTTTQMQVFMEGKPVNIDDTAPLAPSQRNPVVQILNWGVTIWDGPSFLERYRATRSAYLGRDRMLFAIPAERSVKVSHEEDFRLAELMLAARDGKRGSSGVRYWSPADSAS